MANVMTPSREIDVLQHRPPFLFVDAVSPPDEDTQAISGSVSLSPNSSSLFDPCLVPMLVLEALMQLSGVLLHRVTGLPNGGVVAAIQGATFRSHRPSSEPIVMKSEIVDVRFPMFTLTALAMQNDEEFCTCRFVARINE